MEELRFYGTIRSAFEDLTGAIMPGGGECESFESNLRKEYVAAGSPRAATKWIKSALAKLVLAADGMPVWIESVKHRWPWLNDRPMIYLGQTTVPATPASREFAAPGVSLLVFGARVADEHGWSMTYTVVEQHPDL
jgi:hypothetical protein